MGEVERVVVVGLREMLVMWGWGVGACASVWLCFLDSPRICGDIRMCVENKLIRLEALRDVMCCKVWYGMNSLMHVNHI